MVFSFSDLKKVYYRLKKMLFPAAKRTFLPAFYGKNASFVMRTALNAFKVEEIKCKIPSDYAANQP